jgi:hypothetical protein
VSPTVPEAPDHTDDDIVRTIDAVFTHEPAAGG